MAKKKLTLDIWERITLIDIMGQIKGELKLLRKAGKILDALEMTDEEKEQVGLREFLPGRFSWEDDEIKFTIHIRDKEAAALLKRTVEQYQGFMARERKRVEALYEALGIVVEEEEDEKEEDDEEEEAPEEQAATEGPPEPPPPPPEQPPELVTLLNPMPTIKPPNLHLTRSSR